MIKPKTKRKQMPEPGPKPTVRPKPTGPDYEGPYSIRGTAGPVNETVSYVRDIINRPSSPIPYQKKGGTVKKVAKKPVMKSGGVKKTVAKKPMMKMEEGGTKYYKTRASGKSKEISADKYFDKATQWSKPSKYKNTVTNNPEQTNYVYDEKGKYPITTPANTTVRTTKTKGIGKGRSISRVDPLVKEKKGGVVKKVTAKKVMVKSKKK